MIAPRGLTGLVDTLIPTLQKNRNGGEFPFSTGDRAPRRVPFFLRKVSLRCIDRQRAIETRQWRTRMTQDLRCKIRKVSQST